MGTEEGSMPSLAERMKRFETKNPPAQRIATRENRSMTCKTPPPNMALLPEASNNNSRPISGISASASFSGVSRSPSSLPPGSSRSSRSPEFQNKPAASHGTVTRRVRGKHPPKRNLSNLNFPKEKEKEREKEEEEEEDSDEFAEFSMNTAMRLGGVRSVSAKSIVPVDQEEEKTAQIQSAGAMPTKKGKKQRKLKQSRYGSSILEKKSPRSADGKRRPQSELLQTVGSVLKTDHLAWPPFSNKPGVYKGEVDSRGVPNGQGELNLPDGSRYVGNWVFGRKQGYGSFLWANGNLYEGMWHEDKRHGRGTEINTKDKSKLTATFQRGRVNGDAIFDILSGTRINLKYNNGVLLQMKETPLEFGEAKKRTVMGTFTRTMGSKDGTSQAPQRGRRSSVFASLFTEPKKEKEKEEGEKGEKGEKGDKEEGEEKEEAAE